ncbi:MAG: hypothetical protein RBR43_05590 [Desulfuromonadaceae bacterium]|nr:hypothetical protein [Desulfuromonadaceae bacterium]
MQIEEMYTPLEQAREQICQRWADKELRRRVEDFLEGAPPESVSGPRAYLWRAVHTPNREFCRFAELASETGCRPYAMAWHSDRFCSTNPDKASLVRMTCVKGINKRGEPIIQRFRIAEACEFEGIPFRAITTHWGESFIGFQYRLLQECFPAIIPTDESTWFVTHGGTPKHIYPNVLARFICHGILFDNFEDNASASFVRAVVLPAFESISSRFGIKPLIVPLLSENTSGDPSWTWYEGKAMKAVTRCLPPHSLQR